MALNYFDDLIQVVAAALGERFFGFAE